MKEKVIEVIVFSTVIRNEKKCFSWLCFQLGVVSGFIMQTFQNNQNEFKLFLDFPNALTDKTELFLG